MMFASGSVGTLLLALAVALERKATRAVATGSRTAGGSP